MELHFGDQHAVNAVVSVGFYAVDQASEHFPITIDCAQIGNGDSVVALFRRQIALWPVIGHLDKTGCRSSEYLDFPQSRIAKFSPATLHVFDMEFYILRMPLRSSPVRSPDGCQNGRHEIDRRTKLRAVGCRNRSGLAEHEWRSCSVFIRATFGSRCVAALFRLNAAVVAHIENERIFLMPDSSM